MESYHHQISVAKLRELLSQLQDDDLLVPNQVHNLTIVRKGDYVGYIDLLEFDQHVDLFSGPIRSLNRCPKCDGTGRMWDNGNMIECDGDVHFATGEPD